jgi:hypothetical protein
MMFAVLGMTGCRAGEMLGLKIGDLDFNRKVIYIRRSIDSRTKLEQSTKSKNSTAEVPMPPALEKTSRIHEDRIPRKSESVPVRQPERQFLFGWQGNGIRTLACAGLIGYSPQRDSRIPSCSSERTTGRRCSAHCCAAATASRRRENHTSEIWACGWRFATPCCQRAGRKNRTPCR